MTDGTSDTHDFKALPGTRYAIPESTMWEIIRLLDDIVSPKVEYNNNHLLMAKSALDKSRHSGKVIAGILHFHLKNTSLKEHLDVICDKHDRT